MSTSMPESGERGFAAGRLRTALIAAIALTVAGCSTMSGAVLTDSEKALRDESQVFSETVIGGAAAGAALSGLGCALFGGRPADCIATAAAGAVVGAAGGYLVATRQAAAKEQVAEIDIVTRDIAADNQKLAKLVETARNVLEENRAAAKALRARIAKKKAEAGEVEAMQAKLRSNIDVLNGSIEALDKRRNQYTETISELTGGNRDTGTLRDEIGTMEDQIALLTEYRTALEEELDVELMG